MSLRIFYGIVVLAISCLSGCTKHQTASDMTVTRLSEQDLRTISKKKIFFGHQSVGFDIINGIHDVMKQYPAIAVKVSETADPGVFDAPIVAHTTVGRNSDPESKIREFAERVRAGIGGRADIATFKFCYADIERNTDVQRVFDSYKNTMADLAKAYPNTRFVHITVPLKATSGGWKSHIRTLLGKPHFFIADNLRRDELNQKIRTEYAGRQPFFDLAEVESTRADGKASFDRSDSKIVPSLVHAYTYDSGHLNELGRKFVAERFLKVLASL